jgi:hypothetical protein
MLAGAALDGVSGEKKTVCCRIIGADRVIVSCLRTNLCPSLKARREIR